MPLFGEKWLPGYELLLRQAGGYVGKKENGRLSNE
jgi:hypothetical protein